jgi:hypothetical protein
MVLLVMLSQCNHRIDSQQRNDVFLRRLEELEASIDKVSAGVRMFEPSVPMIGTGSKSLKGTNRNGGSDLIGQADDSEFTDPEATGTSGSEATEVMLDLDDSTADAPSFGGR